MMFLKIVRNDEDMAAMFQRLVHIIGRRAINAIRVMNHAFFQSRLMTGGTDVRRGEGRRR